MSPTSRSGAVLDATFDALANEQRRRIIDRLTAGSLPTPELAGHFDLSKQALHRHLVVLEGSGLIERRRQGRVQHLSLLPQPLDEVSGWVGEIRRGWEANADRLARLLDGGLR